LGGFRIRKSIRIFPGVRINFSKTGIGASIGFKGFRLTKRADGKIQKTISLPGTGLSYVDVDSPATKRRQSEIPNSAQSARAKCPSCGEGYRIGGSNFCSKCGKPLV